MSKKSTRIVSYNILKGGEGRADPLAEVLLAQKADIICLVEADDLAVLDRIARRLKMELIVATGGRDGVALLTKWPILETIDHAARREIFTGSFLEAIVEPRTGIELPIAVVHLTARATEEREQVREREIDIVLSTLARHRNASRPHVIAGDFNSNSPTQMIDPSRCKPATQTAWKENGGAIPRRAIQRLLDAGYVDSLHASRGTAADTMHSFTTHWPGQRVDYLFTFGTVPTDAWIEQDRLATYASDHYPVGCAFDLAEPAS